MDLNPRLPVALCGLALAVACDSAPAGDASASGPTALGSEAPAPLPRLDTAEAARAVEAIASAPEPMQASLAAAALAELEEKRLGKSFAAGLQLVSEASIDDRPTVVAQVIDANIRMLDAACEGDAVKTLTSFARMELSERGEALWSACNFAQWGLVAKDVGEVSEPAAMLLAHMAFVALETAGPLDANERALLEMLARSKAAP